MEVNALKAEGKTYEKVPIFFPWEIISFELPPYFLGVVETKRFPEAVSWILFPLLPNLESSHSDDSVVCFYFIFWSYFTLLCYDMLLIDACLILLRIILNKCAGHGWSGWSQMGFQTALFRWDNKVVAGLGCHSMWFNVGYTEGQATRPSSHYTMLQSITYWYKGTSHLKIFWISNHLDYPIVLFHLFYLLYLKDFRKEDAGDVCTCDEILDQ